MKCLGLIALCLSVYAGAAAQTTPAALPRSQAAGAITAVDAAANQLTVRTNSGETLTFAINEKTQLLHALPGQSDPKNWARMQLTEISPGDQAVAYYRGALDQKPLVATSLVIRTRLDVSSMASREIEEWKTRGASGIVASVDPAAKTIALKSGARSITVQASNKISFRRYSADSARPADAKPGTFDDIKTGDQLHVLGNKSTDGSTVEAEAIYYGTFRQIAATIVSIDPASGEMKVNDLATKKPLTVRITADSKMKKMPEQMAHALARRYQPSGNRSATPELPGRAAPARGGDIGQMLDGLPAIAVTGLKPQDAIMLSTTAGSDPNRVTAIMLLAGVEPLLTASPTATRDIMGGWNLGGGDNGQ